MATGRKNKIAGSQGSNDGVQRYVQNLKNAPARETVLHGMVKPSDGADGVMYARVGNCQQWVFIASSAIESIRDTGRTQCGGHTYDLAEIQLKAPADPVAKAYAQVSDLHRTQLAQLAAVAPFKCPDGSDPVQDQYGAWRCHDGS